MKFFLVIFLLMSSIAIAEMRRDQFVLTGERSINTNTYIDKESKMIISECSGNYDVSKVIDMDGDGDTDSEFPTCAKTSNYSGACWVQYVGYKTGKPIAQICKLDDSSNRKGSCKTLKSGEKLEKFEMKLEKFAYTNTGYTGKMGETTCPDTKNAINAAGYVFIDEIINSKDCKIIAEKLVLEKNSVETNCVCDTECQKNKFLPKTSSDTWKNADDKTKKCFKDFQNKRLANFYCTQTTSCLNNDIKTKFSTTDGKKLISKAYGEGAYLCGYYDNTRCGCAKIAPKGGPRHFPRIARNDDITTPVCDFTTVKGHPTCNLFVNYPVLRQFRDKKMSYSDQCKKDEEELGSKYRGTFFRPKGIIQFGVTELNFQMNNLKTLRSSDVEIIESALIKSDMKQISTSTEKIGYIYASYFEPTIYTISYGYNVLDSLSQKCNLNKTKTIAFVVLRFEYNSRTGTNEIVAYEIRGKLSGMEEIKKDINGNIKSIIIDVNKFSSLFQNYYLNVIHDYSAAYSGCTEKIYSNSKINFYQLTKIGSIPRPPLKYYYDSVNKKVDSSLKLEYSTNYSVLTSEYINALKLSIDPSKSVNHLDKESNDDVNLPIVSDDTLLITSIATDSVDLDTVTNKFIPRAGIKNNKCTFLYGNRFCIDTDPCNSLINFPNSIYLENPKTDLSQCDSLPNNERLECYIASNLVGTCGLKIGCQLTDTDHVECQKNNLFIPQKIKMDTSIDIKDYRINPDFRAQQLICITEGIDFAEHIGETINTKLYGTYGDKQYDYVIALSRSSANESKFALIPSRPITMRGLDTYFNQLLANSSNNISSLDSPANILSVPLNYFISYDKSIILDNLKTLKIDNPASMITETLFDHYIKNPKVQNCTTNCEDKIKIREKTVQERGIGNFCIDIQSSALNTWHLKESRRIEDQDYAIYMPLRCQLMQTELMGSGGAAIVERQHSVCKEGTNWSRYDVPKYASTGGGGGLINATVDLSKIIANSNYLIAQVGERPISCDCYDEQWRMNCSGTQADKIYFIGGCHKYREIFDGLTTRFSIDSESIKKFSNIQKINKISSIGDTKLSFYKYDFSNNNFLQNLENIILANKGGSSIDFLYDDRKNAPQWKSSSGTINPTNQDKLIGKFDLYNNKYLVQILLSSNGAKAKLCGYADNEWYATAYTNSYRTNIDYMPTLWSVLKKLPDNKFSAQDELWNIFNEKHGNPGSFYGGGDSKDNPKRAESGGGGLINIQPAKIKHIIINGLMMPDINSVTAKKTYQKDGIIDKQCRVRCPAINVVFRDVGLTFNTIGMKKLDILCEYSGNSEDDMEAKMGFSYYPKKCFAVSKKIKDNNGNDIYGKIIENKNYCMIENCKDGFWDYKDLEKDSTGNINLFDRKYGLCKYNSKIFYDNLMGPENIFHGMSTDQIIYYGTSSGNAFMGNELNNCPLNIPTLILSNQDSLYKDEKFKISCTKNGFWQWNYKKLDVLKNLSKYEKYRKIVDKKQISGTQATNGLYYDFTILENEPDYEYKKEQNDIYSQSFYKEFSLDRKVFADSSGKSLYYCPPITEQYQDHFGEDFTGRAFWDHTIENSKTDGICKKFPGGRRALYPNVGMNRFCKYDGQWAPVKYKCMQTCLNENTSTFKWIFPDEVNSWDVNNTAMPNYPIEGECDYLATIGTTLANFKSGVFRNCNINTGQWDAIPSVTCGSNSKCNLFLEIENGITKLSWNAPYVYTYKREKFDALKDSFDQTISNMGDLNLETRFYMEFNGKTSFNSITGTSAAFQQARYDSGNDIDLKLIDYTVKNSGGRSCYEIGKDNNQNSIGIQLCTTGTSTNPRMFLLDGNKSSDGTKYKILQIRNIHRYSQMNYILSELNPKRNEFEGIFNWLNNIASLEISTGNAFWIGNLSGPTVGFSKIQSKYPDGNNHGYVESVVLWIFIPVADLTKLTIDECKKIELFSPTMAKNSGCSINTSNEGIRFRIPTDIDPFKDYQFIIHYEDEHAKDYKGDWISEIAPGNPIGGSSERLYSFSFNKLQDTDSTKTETYVSKTWDTWKTFVFFGMKYRSSPLNCNVNGIGSIKHNNLKHVMHTNYFDGFLYENPIDSGDKMIMNTDGWYIINGFLYETQNHTDLFDESKYNAKKIYNNKIRFNTLYCYDGRIFGYSDFFIEIIKNNNSNITVKTYDNGKSSMNKFSDFNDQMKKVVEEKAGFFHGGSIIIFNEQSSLLNSFIAYNMINWWQRELLPENNIVNTVIEYNKVGSDDNSRGYFTRIVPRRAEWHIGDDDLFSLNKSIISSIDSYCEEDGCKNYSKRYDIATSGFTFSINDTSRGANFWRSCDKSNGDKVAPLS